MGEADDALVEDVVVEDAVFSSPGAHAASAAVPAPKPKMPNSLRRDKRFSIVAMSKIRPWSSGSSA
ncbi:hypothetical protein, partial [Streptomyces rochei]|uniref:hypothetical protein n=1 Tax=Streptomyces rochei TaxID=1928 RepID=UPI0022E9FB04